MLAATTPSLHQTSHQVESRNRSAQNETTVSDEEISKRLLSIRSSWSVAERMERRREAERRFAELLDKLTAA